MGKTRPSTPPAGSSQKRLRASKTMTEKTARKPVRREVTESGTQTSSAEPGSYEDFREKVAHFYSGVCAALRTVSETRDDPSQREKQRIERKFGCPVCLLPFDPHCRPALCLPCGHSLCQSCVPAQHSRSVLVCPLDFKTFPVTALPVNELLTQVIVTMYPPNDVLCDAHSSSVIGFCEDHDSLVCGFCLFDHKDHNSFVLESSEALELAEERLRIHEQALEIAQSQLQTWTELERTIGTLWQNLAMTPAAMGMQFMYYGQGFSDGSDQSYLMVISEDLSRLVTAVRKLIAVCKGRISELQETISTYNEMTIAQQLALPRATHMSLPAADELFNSFGLLVGRLSYCQNAQFLLAVNQGF